MDYFSQLKALLPLGKIWRAEEGTKLADLLQAMADALARVHARAKNLLAEQDPRTASEAVPDWERLLHPYGDCATQPATIDGRRAACHQKLLDRGGTLSRDFYVNAAAQLGYTITITEFEPWQCGISQCGVHGLDGPDSRFFWKVTVPEAKAVRFECGVSECGEPLLALETADDLECLFQSLNQAHTTLVFDYQGV